MISVDICTSDGLNPLKSRWEIPQRIVEDKSAKFCGTCRSKQIGRYCQSTSHQGSRQRPEDSSSNRCSSVK